MSAQRPSGRQNKAVSPAPALLVNQQNVQELARAYSDGDLNAPEMQEVERQLDANPALREAFERRRKVLAVMAQSVGGLHVSPDFEQKASQRLANRQQMKATRLTQGLDSSAQAISAITLGSEEGDEDERAAPAGFAAGLAERLGSAPWWIISGAFHALLLLMLTLIGMALIRSGEKEVVIVTNLEKQRPPEEIKQEKIRDIFTKPVPIETTEPVINEAAVVTHEEVEVAEHLETANESDAAEAKGTDGIT
ncbi:MAG: hypothetical protein KIS92_24755, partial [Planctomycetota bacterium]|nr:hypothetical protein [Planctomycetota bacterium]